MLGGRLRATILAGICIIAFMVILSVDSPAQAQIVTLAPDTSGNIRYDGNGNPNTRVNLSVSATISASAFGDSIEFYEVDVQPTNYFTIDVTPVSTFSVSGKISWTPLWMNMGGSLNGNTGSFAYSVALTELPYDIKIEAQPIGSSVSVTITSMYLTDDDGDYTAVFNVKNVPDGVYSIKQDGVEVAKAYVGLQIYIMSLITGWNLISIPVSNNTLYASDLVGDASLGADMVAVYNNTIGAYTTYYTGAAAWKNVQLMPDRGYFIHGTKSSSFSVIGAPIPPHNINIYRGWNLVGWSSQSDVKASVILGRVSLSMISRFNNGPGVYQTYYDGASVSKNFTLTAGEGYFLRSETSTVQQLYIG
jgi:hypothetical protein